MSKAVKGMVTDELKSRFVGYSSACVIDMTGMTVLQQETLRKTVRSKKGRVQVVKNSLARLAFNGTSLAPLGASLTGPCALVTSTESIIDVARSLVEAAREFKSLKLKRAIVEGDPNLATVEEVSRMKGRRELVGEIAMLLSSPGRAIAGCLKAPQSKLAGCLKAIVDKGEPAQAA
jgi:large subunit ribosomal protein L10